MDWSWVIFTSLALVAGFLVYFCTPYWRLRAVPGPPVASFLLGHLPLVVKHGHQLFIDLANEYGPIYKIRLGRRPFVIVASPELCEEVFIKKFKIFTNRGIPASLATSPFLSKSLFSSRDKRWSAMKNVILSHYQPSALASLIPTMQTRIELATRHISKTPQDEDINASLLNHKMAMQVIGKSAFGVDFGLFAEDGEANRDDDAVRFIKSHEHSTYSVKMHLKASFSTVVDLVVPILENTVREVFKLIPGTANYKIHQANRNVSEKLDKIIENRAKKLDAGGKDFVSTILRARESDKPTRELFTPDCVRALAYEHLLAGSSSTAFTLSTVLYLVSQHPEVERKLLREIDEFGSHDVIPNADDLHHKFPYLSQVIKESMRFYSGTPLIAREASQQVEIAGYVLAKGTWVWMAVDALTKDPGNFPEPDLFRPERFDPDCEDEKRRHPYSLIPFGLGPRACLGQKFAVQELKLAMINHYRNFTFRLSPNMESPAEFEYGGILVNFKHGVRLRATRRSASQ